MKKRIRRDLMSFLLAAVLATAGNAAPTTPQNRDPELSRSALLGHLKSTDLSAVADRVSEERQRLRIRTRVAPTRRAMGTVVFRSGLTAEALAQFVISHAIDISRADAKAYVSADQLTYTFSLADFNRLSGTLSERLRKSIGHVNAEYMHDAMVANSSDRQRFAELASADIRFFKANVAGTLTALDKIAVEPNVAGVFFDDRTELVNSEGHFQDEMRHVRDTTVSREILRKELTGRFGVTNSVAAGREMQLQILPGSTTNSALVCEPDVGPDGHQFCYLDPDAPPTITGDPIVDGEIAGQDSAAGQLSVQGPPGSSLSNKPCAPGGYCPSVRTLNPFNDLFSCNNPKGSLQDCPNDNTWLPWPRTGGSAVWGVGLRGTPGG